MHFGFFLIQNASFIHPVCRCASLTTTFALSQSMTWFSFTAWSVMADLRVTLLSLALEARVCVPAVKESTSFLRSLILRPDWAVRRTHVGRKKVWCFLTQQFNCCTCASRCAGTLSCWNCRHSAYCWQQYDVILTS